MELRRFEILENLYQERKRQGETMRRVRQDLEQGTGEWLAWRQDRHTASQAPVIMDACPSYYNVRSWADLRVEKVGLGAEPDERTKAAWAHGAKLEDEARDVAFPAFQPLCIEYDSHDRTGAGKTIMYGSSYDGVRVYLTDEGRIKQVDWCEIKCPVSGRKSKMLFAVRDNRDGPVRDRVLPHTWWQLVHQALVLGPVAGDCYLGIYLPDDDMELVRIPAEELLRDAVDLDLEWQRFNRGEEQFSTDLAWDKAARAWIAAKDHLDIVKGNEKEARDILADLVPDSIGEPGEGGREGAGVKAAYVTRTGSVDWQKFATDLYEEWVGAIKLNKEWEGEKPEAFKKLAEGHRKPGSVSFTVRKSKR